MNRNVRTFSMVSSLVAMDAVRRSMSGSISCNLCVIMSNSRALNASDCDSMLSLSRFVYFRRDSKPLICDFRSAIRRVNQGWKYCILRSKGEQKLGGGLGRYKPSPPNRGQGPRNILDFSPSRCPEIAIPVSFQWIIELHFSPLCENSPSTVTK